jgi:hypothetical protein
LLTNDRKDEGPCLRAGALSNWSNMQTIYQVGQSWIVDWDYEQYEDLTDYLAEQAGDWEASCDV